ncbi:hypothetical protein SANTM175S_01827 [Streptomyces antimycoticus]
MYFTDRGIEELEQRRGTEEVAFEWLAEQLRTFVDLNPDFEVPVERLAHLAGPARRGRRRRLRANGVRGANGVRARRCPQGRTASEGERHLSAPPPKRCATLPPTRHATTGPRPGAPASWSSRGSDTSTACCSRCSFAEGSSPSSSVIVIRSR